MDFFPQEERDTATVVLTMANVLGQLLGSLLPPYLVVDDAGISAMMLYTAIPSVSVFVLGVFVLRKKPPSPPSQAAAAQWAEEDTRQAADASTGASPLVRAATVLGTVLRDVRMLLADCNFALLLAGFSVAVGMAWALLTVQAQIIQPCGYDDTIAGNSGASLLGVGVVCSFAIGPVLQRWRAYALVQKLAMAAAAAAVAFVLAANRPGGSGLIYGAWCTAGAALMPLVPITLEHAAEATYPVAADTSSAVLLTGANLAGMVLIFALGPMLQLPASAACASVVTPAAGLVMACMLLGAALTLPLHAVHRRQDAEAAAAASVPTCIVASVCV